MRKVYAVLVLSLLASCFTSENWEIKKISLGNKGVYLKSHTWAIPERNSIILSNNEEKMFNSKTDIDFGSFVGLVYEVKNDSLIIYQASTDEQYFSKSDRAKTFYNTKIKFVNTTLYMKMQDSLNSFPSK